MSKDEMAFVRRRARGIVSIALLAATCACTPTHTVKPLPAFVDAALQPGDTAIVTTADGKKHKFVVTEVGDRHISGGGQRYSLGDIAELKKVAWERPDSPCKNVESLGCSVPLLVSIVSDRHAHYSDEFHDACADHDYCYRHGYRTYGYDREACDQAFLDDMLALCPPRPGNVLARVLDAFDDSLDSHATCVSVARDFHRAVRRYGEERFLTDQSTWCEYDGPMDATPD